MTIVQFSVALLAAGTFAAGPAIAETRPDGPKKLTQQTAQKQKTDGDGPAMVGPASGAYKQRTDGEGPPMVGPASGAASGTYK